MMKQLFKLVALVPPQALGVFLLQAGLILPLRESPWLLLAIASDAA
jgi:hypothetical protein